MKGAVVRKLNDRRRTSQRIGVRSQRIPVNLRGRRPPGPSPPDPNGPVHAALFTIDGAAEQLPAPDGTFGLVLSTTSFDHWRDQRAGLTECARVLVPGGHLVRTDLFSAWLWPTLLTSRRGKARTKGRATGLLTAAGLRSPQWHHPYAVIIQTVTATK